MFGAFGGLRSSEIFRMKWSDVRLEEGQFYIEGSKNEGAERWIKMTPPLMDFCKAILEGEDFPDGLVMGGMTSQTQQRKIEEAYKKAGYRIPKNGLRHSFGSHHLVQYQNGDNTANEMGHIGPTMTFKAYRKAVLKSQAASYFAIRCSAKPWVIIKGLGIKKPQKLAEEIAA
jgi:integrase